MRDMAHHGKPELEVRREPILLKRETRRAHFAQHFREILSDEMRQQVTVVQRRPPPHRPLSIRLFQEPRDHGPHEQLLSQTHPGMRRHLKPAKLDQPQPARRRVGRIELVDAEFGAVRVARHIDQQMAKHAIDQPRRRLAVFRQLRERGLQFVNRLVTRFVHPRRLARRPNEQTRE